MTEEVTTQEQLNVAQEQPEVPQEIQLQEYGLAEFIKQIEVKVNEGYRLDLDSNEGYPQQYGTMFTARMLKTGNRSSVKFDVPKEPMFLKTADEVVIPDPVDPTEVAGVNEITENQVPPRGLETTVVQKVDGRTKQAKAK